MTVVPMGWSWAMFFAQRIHQHQVMLGAGVGADQILVDGRPAPSLSSGQPIIVPYADNLNVLGTDQHAVQEIKDKAVARLRQVGFRVHEEEDASTRAKALGFMIDGERCRVTPVPEKCDKVILALKWLSARPTVSGRVIERIVGHCVHFFMLRREFLSVFRSVYDFKSAHYCTKKRLWRTAADECRWAANLLLVCESDMAKPWSDQISVSDACLTGTATCAMQIDPSIAQAIGRGRELWRYKSSLPAVKARELVQSLDPFRDVETVLPKRIFEDPFQLNSDFENVPEHIARSSQWKLQFASRMTFKEHITLLEGRATVQAIRHKARSIKHFNQRHVHLGDNLGMVLAFDRGRAKSPQLLFCCRKAAAYSVATNSIVHHRWVPSEWNAADGPSRQWEGQDTHPGPSKRSKKKALDQILYPSTREKKQAIQQRFRDSVGSAGAQGCGGPGIRALALYEHGRDPTECSGKDRGGAPEETRFLATWRRPCRLGSPARRSWRFCQSRQRPQQTTAAGSWCFNLQATGASGEHRLSGQPCVDRTSEPVLPRWFRHLGGHEVFRGSAGGFSGGGKDRAHSSKKSFEGLEECGPGPGPHPAGLAICQPDSNDNVGSAAARGSSFHSHNATWACRGCST